MSIFGSSARVGPDKPQFTGLQVQTSSQAIHIPIIFGKNRVSPNLIWYDDFKAIKHVEKVGGKGGPSVKQISYTYEASFIMALCEGQISDIDRVWRDKELLTDYTTLGFSLFTGAANQAPWGYLTSSHPEADLGYTSTAYLAVANYDLGDTANLPNHTFEVEGLLFDTLSGGNGDADPAQIIEAIFTSTQYGVGFPASSINTDTLFSGPNAPTTGDSAYQTYCRALGLGLSPALTDSEPTLDIIAKWCKLTNTAPFWSGAKLKFVPYGDEEVTANGVTFLPPTTVRAALSDNDYLYSRGEDPVKITRSDPADAYNLVRIEVRDRQSAYNLIPVEAKDQASIEKFGVRQARPIKAHEVCELSIGSTMAYLMLQRGVYVRNTYRFRLSWEHCLLEAMDIVTLTSVRLGLSAYPVRIIDVEENEDGELDFTAEDFPEGVASTFAPPIQSNDQTPLNSGADPGDVNAPVFFEPPGSELTEGRNELWIAVSGGDGMDDNPNWGGCFVWVSLDDSTYEQIGVINAPVRMGVLAAALPDYNSANPDTVNTAEVDVAISGAELFSTTAQGAADAVTLCLVGGELISYQTATLQGTDLYDLDTLYRGLYGTSTEAHSMGAAFVRYDGNEFKYEIPDQYVGVQLYFKFTSFNIFGQSVQDLADATAYTYTPDGGGVPAPAANLTATDGYGFVTLNWEASPTLGISGYRVYAVNNHTGNFASASVIATVGPDVTSWTHSGLPGDDDWRYWIVAYNVAGESTEDGPEDATTLTRSPLVFFVSGAPDDMDGDNGDFSYDTSVSPFVGYIKENDTWRKITRGALDYLEPTNGFSTTISLNVETLVLNPAGTLATGTITMPAAPRDGDHVAVVSTEIITSLTVSPNTSQSIEDAPITIAAGGSFELVYRDSDSTWYRLI